MQFTFRLILNVPGSLFEHMLSMPVILKKVQADGTLHVTVFTFNGGPELNGIIRGEIGTVGLAIVFVEKLVTDWGNEG